ncbi:MAG: GntR family transcriptional regulator [Tepidiphilus sp.]|jgi:GntR family transcriptional regulator|uniref:DNA-binding transcriptional regulator, GntR family n=1 Tax=Tepidiphilus thermophilus TaxID=876478 RepID=A0A0K6IWA3_9PROT|nr:GntR family transcriptional regulator [Tepidiphilus thermophilus]MBP6999328.1 GntR family transcriptional regulator [Tepidiphilus sp.]MDK2797834.1 GntR family transcriptional regulator [Tepidiphilus sp.]CUB07368.1 DNA-binding transcriptional regulator, GntR family [Tepidiphilus thermophilus]
MASNAPTFSPLYRQIKSLIVQALESGEWRPGEAIPSEQELAARFGVSQGTVRKAVDELAAENVLVRKQGKGTFVVSHHDPRQFFRFLRLVPDDGSLTQPQSVPLDCWRAKAGQEAARVLQIPVGDPIIILRRVLKFSGKPVVLDEIYLPGEVFEGLTLDTLKEWKGSLYSFFETRFGVRMLRAEEHIRAVAADRMAAETLGVKEGTPLLSVERVTYTYNDRPVEWRRGRYLTTQYHYHNELT